MIPTDIFPLRGGSPRRHGPWHHGIAPRCGDSGKLLQEHAPQQYTVKLTIDALVGLLIQVAAGHRATVFAAYTADQAATTPTIPTSYQALYGKLDAPIPILAKPSSGSAPRYCGRF